MSADAQAGARHYLEVVRLLALELKPTHGTVADTAANDCQHGGRTLRQMSSRRCADGERTASLTTFAGILLGRGLDVLAATDLCLAWNDGNDPPLPEEKVRDTVASMARTHARNHPLPPGVDEPLFELSAASVGNYLDRPPPTRRWLLTDCLPLGKVALLIAPGGTGKSQLAMQLAVAVATGGTLAGYWSVGEPGAVLALFGEEDDEELHRRFRAVLRVLEMKLGGSDAEKALRSNLYVKAMTGETTLMTKLEAGNSVARTAFAERLCATVAEVPDVKLVIIDPVSRFRGGDENVAEHATRFVEAAELIAKVTGATVLLLHHANKASSKDPEQNQSAARGSSALTDGVRWQMNLSAMSDKQAEQLGVDSKGEFVAIKVTKNNYAPTGEGIFLRRGQEGVLSYYDAKQEQHAARVDRMQQLVQLVRDLEDKGQSYSKSALADRFGGITGPFRIGKNKLCDLITDTIAQGYLKQAPGSAKILKATEKEFGIQRAKVVM